MHRYQLRTVLSHYIFICFALFSCAPSRANQSDYRAGVLQAERLLNEYGELEGEFLTAYFRDITSRLTAALPAHERPAQAFTVRVLDRPEPMAITTGGSHILLSHGLIKRLASEAELAFVIAHEMSHQLLEHLNELREGALTEEATSAQHALELQADRYAVGLMALADYDPRVAPSAIFHASGLASIQLENGTHPSLQSRISNVEEAIVASHWAPPGIVDTRTFRKLIATL